ncbi:hypothetical protein C7C46_06585 [Streptomyces tateyamensis]|uniref:Uncharacterized protein n=1 Tax=Streptomyces tateyamensis TaxID=565073 RepID=A0A2V4NJ54_9ACTN|nr:helix-turn-helix domain-containing protein [Streptomyces tateyamensis]PYC85403.1 hypothetical protein C7C46_06585 [Streptomyces tateyamensis]
MASAELDRTMVVDLYRQGESMKAIAALMGVSPSTISKRLDGWGERKRDVREVGRLHATSGTKRGKALGRKPWAEAFVNAGGRQHCPTCREMSADHQRARSRADSDAMAEIVERFAAHAVQSHPHMRRLYGD